MNAHLARLTVLLSTCWYSQLLYADAYILVKLNALDGSKLPKLLALQSRKPPKGKALSKEVLKHRGRHLRLSGDLSLLSLEPGWYQLVHLDMTWHWEDPGTRYLDFVPLEILPDTVTFLGDFDLIERRSIKAVFRSQTIEDACNAFSQFREMTLVVPYFTSEPLRFPKPCEEHRSEEPNE